MSDPVSSIKNLGPASDKSFARAEIHSAEEIRKLGADETYRRLLASGTRPHFIGYYALVMGLQGRLWNTILPDEKLELRKRFDALKSGRNDNDKGRLELEAALNKLGVVQKD